MTISYSGNFMSLLRRWKGSVWKAVWKEMMIFLISYYIVRLVIDFCLNLEQRKAAIRVVSVFDSFTNKIPLQFLLGFYVGQVVSRWWAQVQAVPWPDDIMVWTNAFFYKNDPLTRLKRLTIARYLILCETLVFRSVSTRIRKRFPTIQSLVKAGLMTQAEYNLYQKVAVENTRWQLPLQWIINGIIVPAQNDNEIPGAGAGTLIGKINDFRNGFRSIFIYDWVCIPLVYTQTCSVVVYGYFGLCLFGHQYAGKEADLYIPYLTLLQFVFFIGWFKVAQDLMRPFGEDDDDVELNVILDRHTAVVMNFADQLCDLNPVFPKKFTFEKGGDASQTTSGEGGLTTLAYIDDAEEQVAYESPPFMVLPYSRASLRYPKDHAPKLHASVKLKTPEEAEFFRVSGQKKRQVQTEGGLNKQLTETLDAIHAWQNLMKYPYDRKTKLKGERQHF